MLTYIVAGLATGSVYSLAGMGLVLTYKTSGVFNFAHGAVGAIGAFAFWELRTNTFTLPWPIALVLALLFAGPLVGLLIGGIAGPLARVSSAMKIVAMVGLLLVIQGLATVRYGEVGQFFDAFLPTRTVRAAGVNIGIDQLILMGIAAISAVGLWAYLQFTRSGKLTRAVVDNEELVALTGANPRTIHRVSWMIGSTFAAMSGILLAPTLGLQVTLLTLVVVAAFGGAAVGRFDSLPLTYGGGLLLGVLAAVSTRYVPDFPRLEGVPDSVPFIVLFVALLVMRKRGVAEEGAAGWARTVAHASPRVRSTGLVVALALVSAVPLFIDTRLALFTSGLIYVVLFLSLGFLVRTSGQTSLAHIGFAAIGASTFAHFSGPMPWLLAFVGAGLVTLVVGALVGIPAIRLSGLYLALATFGFGILLQRLAYSKGFMFGATGDLDAPRPGFSWLSSDVGFYYVCVAVAAVVATAIMLIQRSRLGRLSRAMADAPVALVSAGTSVNLLRVVAFCISSFVAGLAGALLAMLSGSVNGNSFQPLLSLTLLAVLIIQGPGTVRPALLAALGLAIAPSYVSLWTHSDEISHWTPVLFGLIAIVVALGSAGQRDTSPRWRRAVNATQWRRRSPVTDRAAVVAPAPREVTA